MLLRNFECSCIFHTYLCTHVCTYIKSIRGIHSFHIASCLRGRIQSTRLLSQCMLPPRTKVWKSHQEIVKQIWSWFLLSNQKLKKNMLKLDFFATESCSGLVHANAGDRLSQILPPMRTREGCCALLRLLWHCVQLMLSAAWKRFLTNPSSPAQLKTSVWGTAMATPGNLDMHCQSWWHRLHCFTLESRNDEHRQRILTNQQNLSSTSFPCMTSACKQRWTKKPKNSTRPIAPGYQSGYTQRACS